MLARYQADHVADPSPVKALLCGRRIGKSHAQNMDSSLDMVGLRVRADGAAFERDPGNVDGSPQYHTSITEQTAQANVAQVYAFVETWARTGLLAAAQWPDGDPNIGYFRLRNGVECRALSGAVKTAGRSKGGSWTGDEISFVADLDQLLAAALPMAGPSLGRPHGFKIRLASSAFIADSTAHRILVGDGGPLDKWAHISRRSVTLTDAVMLHNFPAPGMTDEQKATYLLQRRNEVGDDVYFTEYENVWISGSESFISPELLDRCRYEPSEFPEKHDVVRTVMGVDLARSATGNLTVLSRVSVDRSGVGYLHVPQTMRGVEYTLQETAIGDAIEEGVTMTAADGGGLGGSTCEALTKRFSSARFRTVIFNATNKGEMLEAMRHAFETGKLRVPADPGLLRDIVSLRKRPRPGGTWSYTAGTGTDGSHADRAISSALGWSVANVNTDTGISARGRAPRWTDGRPGSEPWPTRGGGLPWG